jgi:hypothetical protein
MLLTKLEATSGRVGYGLRRTKVNALVLLSPLGILGPEKSLFGEESCRH